MKRNGEENIKGKSYEEIEVANKPTKAKDHKFDVGEMRIMTIGAVSRPGTDANEEVCYLPVGGKADEWIDESTVAKMMPLNDDVACFVSGYKAGYRDGFKDAQEKDQKYMVDFMTQMFERKEEGEPHDE